MMRRLVDINAFEHRVPRRNDKAGAAFAELAFANHSAPMSPMPLVASTLGPNEIEALASYLSFVK